MMIENNNRESSGRPPGTRSVGNAFIDRDGNCEGSQSFSPSLTGHCTNGAKNF